MRIRMLCAVVALVGLAGCGGDDEPAPTSAPPSTVPEVDRGPGHFLTPSKNVGCIIAADYARCDVVERDWEPPPKPADCDLDWGTAISIADDGAAFVCAGDTTLGGPDTLDYGATAQRGRYLCTSATDGLTCRDVRTNKGFFLSRERYRLL